MKRMNFKVTVEELRLLASLASDQLFRRQFIDPRMPGYKGSPEDVELGKALVGRMHLLIDESARHPTAALSPTLPLQRAGGQLKNVFVGNLSSGATSEAIRSLFESLGTVRTFKLMTDRGTGQSRGFAFVEMTEAQASRAIAALNGRIVDGRAIEVREGRPKLHRRLSDRLAPQTPKSRLP